VCIGAWRLKSANCFDRRMCRTVCKKLVASCCACSAVTVLLFTRLVTFLLLCVFHCSKLKFAGEVLASLLLQSNVS
jgi:hypothetical protein